MKLSNIALVIFFLGLSACYLNNFETVITLDCGGMELQFEENEFRGPPDMPLSHFPKLYLTSNHLPRRKVDSLYHSGVPEAYQLLGTEDNFLPFPPVDGLARTRAGKYHPRDIFVDPAEFSPEEYNGIKACLSANIKAIDAAFDRPLFKDGYASHLRLRSVVYRPYDDSYRFCGDKVIGKRFDCAGGKAYIKTIPPLDLQLCRTGSDNTNAKDLIGRINGDHQGMRLRGPGSTGPADHPLYGLKALAGPDWKGFYETCRDSSGKTIFDYFKEEPWPN